MHTQSIQGGFRHIKEDCVYIHQQIDDVLRDPNLDMLRQAAKRIEFTLRRMKWDFEHLTGLYDDMKRKVAELEKALAEAKAAAAASTDTETDVSVIGTDKGTEAATVVGSDVGSDDTTDVATEGDSDGIETPTGSESPSDVDSVIDDVSNLINLPSRPVCGFFF